MQRCLSPLGGLALALGLLASPPPAHALITRLTPLGEVIEQSTFVLTVKVEKVDSDRPAMVLAVDKHLKGKVLFARLPVALKGDAAAVKAKEPAKLLRRVAVKQPVVLFVSQRDKEYLVFAYTEGTWFQLAGAESDGTVRWRFTHLEPYLRRTFKGGTRELVDVVTAVLAGKRKAPPPDPKEKPGLGPEVKRGSRLGRGSRIEDRGSSEDTVPSSRSSILYPRSSSPARSSVTQGPVFAVIPTVLIGGPLAFLAMLFPAVFAGWKRWLAFLSVAATAGTLYTLHYWLGPQWTGRWWATPAALWTGLTLLAVAGAGWAWRRHAARVQAGEAPPVPGKVELAAVLALSLSGLAVVGYCAWYGQSLLTPSWLPVLAFSLAVWAGTLFALFARLRGPRSAPASATEAVTLTCLALACTALGATQPTRPAAPLAATVEPGDDLLGGEGSQSGNSPDGLPPGPPVGAARKPRLVWTFRAPEKGAIASSPLAAGDRVYVAVAHDDIFRPYGALYCLDRATGKPVWTFHDGKKMKQVFSSPVLADGKVYVGEGFHQDAGCKVYCLDAATGEKVWEFPTQSHTESTAVVAGGRVYIGAGDEGLYCLDARTGKKVWNFPGFHIDAPPVLVGRRLYVGAGVGDYHKETALFCLDARTGKRLWRVDTPWPVWGRPAVAGGHVYFGFGNGRMNESDEKAPAGEVRCVRAEDGGLVWSTGKLPDAVVGDLTAAGRYVYFGCRDGRLYCLTRASGKPAWKASLGSPVAASPSLTRCDCCGAVRTVIAAASAGQLFCLAPHTGKTYWAVDLAGQTGSAPEVLATPGVEVRRAKGGAVRRVYVAATLISTARTAELYCFEDELTPAR
jgi:outer membrane protein assembly factor BamB